MNKIITIIFCIVCNQIMAQELFVMTEPASNIPAKAINIRAGNYFMQIDSSKKTSYHLVPEFGIGITSNLMLKFTVITSNRTQKMGAEGINLYGKYRFLSTDNVHKHLRLAAYARYSYNVAEIHMQETNLPMHNSGYELGAVATQLLHKTAISTNVSFQRATNIPTDELTYHPTHNSINYALSIGQLVLPKQYKSYKQTNFNVMLELIGQYNQGLKAGFVDIVPSVQFIFNSVARIDLAYRTNLQNNLIRSFSKGIILKFEYNIFNAIK